MMRLAERADVPQLDAFLTRHADTSMFLRSNLASFGVDDRAHRNGTAYHLWQPEGAILAVFGVTNGGYLSCQIPTPQPRGCVAFARQIDGRDLLGMTGVPEQVEAVLAALHLQDAPFALLQDEPLCTCDLADLPEVTAQMRAPDPDDLPMLEQWWTQYALDTGMTQDAAQARRDGADRPRMSIDSRRLRLLIAGSAPVAMAGLNSVAGDRVQVGGVFVPPSDRNRGLGRTATAALLHEARTGGARRAILFANNAAAERAYAAIGFRRIGQFRVALFDGPQQVVAHL